MGFAHQLVTVSACKDFQVSDQIQIILLDNLKDSSECGAADVALPGDRISCVRSIGPLNN